MKKTIIILTLLSFVLCLSAQLTKEIKASDGTEKEEKLIKEKKADTELKLKKKEEVKKTVQVKKVEHKKVQKAEVDALKKANKVLQAERDECKIKLESVRKNRTSQEGMYKKLQLQIKELKRENAELKSKLEKLKPSDPKKIKTIEKG